MHQELLSQEKLDRLKATLPELHFDPQQDARVGEVIEQVPECQSYLEHYGLPSPDGVHQALGYFVTENYRIACQYWLPESPRATVCVIHGYFDHMGLYGHLIDYLLGNNYGVMAFDLPGHGLSSGEQVSIESFHHYVHVLSQLLDAIQQLPKPYHAVGQSTGGAILLSYLLLRQFLFQPVDFEKVALLAPLIKPAHWRKGKLSYNLTHRFRDQVKRVFQDNSSNPEFLDFVKNRDPLQARFLSVEWVGAMKQWIHDFSIMPRADHPLTLIQGEMDATVDWKFNTRAIQKKFPNSNKVLIPEANHHLVNETEVLRQQVFSAMGFE